MKPGCYTKIYIHLVFAVKTRQALLKEEFRPIIFKYMSGIISKMGNKSIIINGVSDHVHVFFALNPKLSVSEIVHELKRQSSVFINHELPMNCEFNWQAGYGAFSYNQSQIKNVYRYIENQEIHHKKENFRKEFIETLKKWEINYDERFLFDFRD